MAEHRIIKARDTQYMDKSAFAAKDFTEVRWLAGAGLMINARGTLLMIDPLLATIKDKPRICEDGLEMVVDHPIKAQDVPHVDAVLYTHSDGDHLGVVTAKVLETKGPVMIGPPPVFEKLARAGAKQEIIQVCRFGDAFTFGCVTVDVIKADHPWQLQDPVRYGKPFRPGDACGYKITCPDGVLLAPGDTRLMEEHLGIKGVDVLFLDVSRCEYHLNVKGAITLANCMSDALLIPYHWGTYNAPEINAHNGDPEDVFSQVTGRERREKTLAPGEPFRIREGKELL